MNPTPKTIEKEEWRAVPGFDGIYEISNQGNFRSYLVRSRWGKMSEHPILVKGNLNIHGYHIAHLRNKEGRFGHRLVAEAFIPNPENKPQVNHKNGIKTDNRVENLEWVTASENQLHAYKTGLKHGLKGVDCPSSILSEKEVLEIRKLAKEGCSKKDLSKRFLVTEASIKGIITRKSWKHLP